MPKYCSAQNCRNDSGSGSDRKSFYKFPLQEPERLQLWLRNMGREDWAPSRHQYLCHQHFEPACFKVRWGIRYLENDAVPTVFQEAEKRKAGDHCVEEQKPKRLRATGNQSVSGSGEDGTAAALETDSALHTVRLYEITVDPPSQQAESNLVESSSNVGESDAFETTEAGFPLTLFQTTVDDESGEVVLMSDCGAGEGQDQIINGIRTALFTQNGLIINESALTGLTDEARASLGVGDVTFTAAHQEGQVIAYFQMTDPHALPGKSPAQQQQFSFSPDTVLSSALSSEPISSTLPIVSKHTAPPGSAPGPALAPAPAPAPEALVLTTQRADTEDGEEDPEEDEQPLDPQLEEHCYHKSSLSREQLEALVGELQRRVKVLQQRHRRHLDKLLGLEATVSQLRQSNLLHEERLALLERALIQSSATVSEAGETVIIYGEDEAAYLYTTLNHTHHQKL